MESDWVCWEPCGPSSGSANHGSEEQIDDELSPLSPGRDVSFQEEDEEDATSLSSATMDSIEEASGHNSPELPQPRYIRSKTSSRFLETLKSERTPDVDWRGKAVGKMLLGPVFTFIVVYFHFAVIDVGDALHEADWWKCMAACVVVWIPLTATTMTINLAHWVHEDLLGDKLSFGRVLPPTMIIGGIVFVAVWWPLLFLGEGWTYKPAPFVGYIAAFSASCVMAGCGWFTVSPERRRLDWVQQPLRATILFNMSLTCVVLLYVTVLAVFTAFSSTPLLVTLPLSLAGWLARVWCNRVLRRVDADNTKVFLGLYIVQILHFTFLATFVARIQSWSGAAALATIDLLLNAKHLIEMATGQHLLRPLLATCCPGRCSWAKEPSEAERESVRLEAGSQMIASEASEIIQPLLYFALIKAICSSSNAKHMAGIGVATFHHHAMTGSRHLLGSIVIMIAADGVALATTLLLTRRLGLDLIDFYLLQIDRHWLPVTMLQVWALDTVLCEAAVGCFVDYSLEFDWMR